MRFPRRWFAAPFCCSGRLWSRLEAAEQAVLDAAPAAYTEWRRVERAQERYLRARIEAIEGAIRAADDRLKALRRWRVDVQQQIAKVEQVQAASGKVGGAGCVVVREGAVSLTSRRCAAPRPAIALRRARQSHL